MSKKCAVSMLGLVTAIGGVTCAEQTWADEAASRAAPASQLEEIVVTARRRDERLQDVPVAVTAVTGQTLEAAGVATTARLGQVTPGLVMAHSASSFQPALRGVTTNVAGVGSEQPIALYIDGIYQPDQSSNQIDLVNIERIEVLRGPQGTLFGRNATGGLINIITRDPTSDPEASIGVRYGSYEERSVKLYASGGLTDTLAFSASAMVAKRDGHIKDLIRGGTTDHRESSAFRAKLLYRPTENISAKLIAAYSKLDDPGVVTGTTPTQNTQGRAVNPNIIRSTPYGYTGNIVPKNASKVWDTALILNWERGDYVLESTTSFKDYRSQFHTETDGSPIALGDGNISYLGKVYTQELRVLYDAGGRLNLTAGVYGFSTTGFSRTVVGVNRTVTPNVEAVLLPKAKTFSKAAFAEGTYKITDKLNATAGVRYTHEKRVLTQYANGRLILNHVSSSFEKVTPRFILQYYLAPDTNIYASYSVGFKSGQYNPQATSAIPVRPETNRAYEAGLKAQPLANLRTNLAAFFYDYTDLQIGTRDPVTALNNLQNAGAAEMKGVEAEILWSPIPDLEFQLTGSLLDAKYTDLKQASVVVPIPAGGNRAITYDATGNPITRSPKFSFSLNTKYGVDLGGGRLEFNSSIYRSARVYQSVDKRLWQPAYWMFNGEVSYELANGQTRFTVWGENLGNAKIIDTINPVAGGDIYYYARPRTVGVSLNHNF